MLIHLVNFGGDVCETSEGGAPRPARLSTPPPPPGSKISLPGPDPISQHKPEHIWQQVISNPLLNRAITGLQAIFVLILAECCGLCCHDGQENNATEGGTPPQNDKRRFFSHAKVLMSAAPLLALDITKSTQPDCASNQ